MQCKELIPLTQTLIDRFVTFHRLGFSPYHWRRFTLRLLDRVIWHWRGVLLWLLPRAFLRYLPFPYPAIAAVKDWKLQAEAMIAGSAMSCMHFQRDWKLVPTMPTIWP